jgi:hypothetical protein
LYVKYPPPDDVQVVPVVVKRAAVQVQGVDFTTETVTLDLNGSVLDTTGTLTFEFEDSSGSKVSQTTTTYYQPANGVQAKFDRLKIPKGTYPKLNVKWNTVSYRFGANPVMHTVEGSLTPSKPWNVLGVTRFSQYNTPAETQCVGSPATVWKVDSVDTCNFEEVQLKSDFVSQVQLNGTGKSEGYGILKAGAATSLKKSCKGKFPDGADQNNSFVQVSSVTGACNKVLVPNDSIAMNPYNPTWKCGNKFLLVTTPGDANKGTRTNQDKCPACTDDHIDNYTDVEKCSAHEVGDLGKFWTVQTK